MDIKEAGNAVQHTESKRFSNGRAFLIILAIVLSDQFLKIYIKTHYQYGESHLILGNWFRFHFIENDGMAWGWKLNAGYGKLLLTLFRIGAVVWGTFFIPSLIKKNYHKGLLLCACLIYAGALGNLLDSVFYGLIFDKGAKFDFNMSDLVPYDGVARVSSNSYGTLFYGNVVDMIYCPVIYGYFPSWVPFIGGERFHFFNAIFNIADASISIGVIILILFQKKFKVRHKHKAVPGSLQ